MTRTGSKEYQFLMNNHLEWNVFSSLHRRRLKLVRNRNECLDPTGLLEANISNYRTTLESCRTLTSRSGLWQSSFQWTYNVFFFNKVERRSNTKKVKHNNKLSYYFRRYKYKVSKNLFPLDPLPSFIDETLF